MMNDERGKGNEGRLVGIFVADAAAGPVRALESANLVVGRGVEGDRYFLGTGAFSRWPGSGRQVSIIEAEALDEIRTTCGTDLRNGEHRRNLVVTGVRLAGLVDKTFRVGAAVLRGERLCLPCKYLQRRVGAAGVFEAMRGRGGLRASVVSGGAVRVGDTGLLG